MVIAIPSLILVHSSTYTAARSTDIVILENCLIDRKTTRLLWACYFANCFCVPLELYFVLWLFFTGRVFAYIWIMTMINSTYLCNFQYTSVIFYYALAYFISIGVLSISVLLTTCSCSFIICLQCIQTSHPAFLHVYCQFKFDLENDTTCSNILYMLASELLWEMPNSFCLNCNVWY